MAAQCNNNYVRFIYLVQKRLDRFRGDRRVSGLPRRAPPAATTVYRSQMQQQRRFDEGGQHAEQRDAGQRPQQRLYVQLAGTVVAAGLVGMLLVRGMMILVIDHLGRPTLEVMWMMMTVAGRLMWPIVVRPFVVIIIPGRTVGVLNLVTARAAVVICNTRPRR